MPFAAVFPLCGPDRNRIAPERRPGMASRYLLPDVGFVVPTAVAATGKDLPVIAAPPSRGRFL
ncbi:hypothetical protein D3C72_1294080 [compost metagenome]